MPNGKVRTIISDGETFMFGMFAAQLTAVRRDALFLNCLPREILLYPSWLCYLPEPLAPTYGPIEIPILVFYCFVQVLMT